jgi:hypothetical protein
MELVYSFPRQTTPLSHYCRLLAVQSEFRVLLIPVGSVCSRKIWVFRAKDELAWFGLELFTLGPNGALASGNLRIIWLLVP